MNNSQQGAFVPKKVDVKFVHGDLAQEVISITVDRLSLILHKHGSDLGKNRDWMAPAGVLLSLLLTFATTDFKQQWLSADTWNAIFVLLTAASAIWLLKTMYTIFKTSTIEDLIEKIKRQD